MSEALDTRPEIRYCVYAKPSGWIGWLQPWTLVGVSEVDRGFASGYGPEFYDAGFKLIHLKMETPLEPGFFFLPKKATVLGTIQK